LDIRLDTFTRYGNGHQRVINALLAAAALIVAVWLLKALWQPVYVLDDAGKKSVKAARPAAVRTKPSKSAYDVVVDKDLFRSSRQRFVVQIKPKAPVAVVVAPPPPPPKPAPKLNLIGTVLLDNEQTAIIEQVGSPQKASYYKKGDSIEEFVLTEIHEDFVIFKRADEVLKVVMNPSVSAPPQPYTQQQNGAPPAGAQPLMQPMGMQPPAQPSGMQPPMPPPSVIPMHPQGMGMPGR
jgi:hypothetical protein